MDLLVLAPQWAIAAFVALLLLAALQDVLQRKISNLLCAGLLLLALVVAAVTGPAWPLWQNLLAFAGALAIGTWMFSAGVMGGGDIKLLAATLLWFDLGSAARLLVSIAILGGILALLVMFAGRMRRRAPGAEPRAHRREKVGVPYAVAIAGGALLMLLTAF